MAEPGSLSQGSGGPVEHVIREKITSHFAPSRLEIYNDSHLHKHHKAMADSTSAETHFRLVITSGEFRGKPQIRRHRMVNELLKEDLAREGGIHALQLKTMTPEEDAKKPPQQGEGGSS
ncbi:bola-like protein [Cryphonectria parasitica EP155]|uniref:Bola-like protein n=1 Tax=Cryphonectria parasitica (strain ATCC 38755 / EP155) TaxID=660469 RepID=A0A9P4XZV4_CRYP1|nr:bola-like protein [Cryphonectria parasitica EP155]KAF3763934.1 bola-like protein [Cryphonectria parasitica EP155]